jgi:hypothetical protein
LSLHVIDIAKKSSKAQRNSYNMRVNHVCMVISSVLGNHKDSAMETAE